MTFATLILMLSRLAMVEQPDLHEASRWTSYLDGMTVMAGEYLDVGREGALISPDADPLLLAVIGYEESRHRPRIADGDCDHTPQPKCRAIGPMQLSNSLPALMPRIDPGYAALKVAALREPRTAVLASYRLLRYYRDTCHGGPAQWLGAWSAGKCSTRPIALGARRCQLAAAMARAADLAPIDCGERPLDVATRRRVEAIAVASNKAEK